KFLERLLGGQKRVDARLHDEPSELDNASVFLDHRGRQIVKARRSGLMQPAQDRRALFLGRPAKTDERALGCGDGAPRVLLVAQGNAAYQLAARRTDDVHDLAAVGFDESSIDVMCRER